jgi:hypothetical protein
MLIQHTELTPALFDWIEGSHDDGRPGLTVSQRGAHILVTRQDGTDPSETEIAEIDAILAAHAVEPLAGKSDG